MSEKEKAKSVAGWEAFTERCADQKTAMQCNECGKKFKKRLADKTFEVKCPKCGGYDTEII